MRPLLAVLRRTSRSRGILATSIIALLSDSSAHAANQTWDGGSTSGMWPDVANWVGNTAAPGANTGTTNTDVALFNTSIANTWGDSAANPILIDSGRNLGGISFDGAPGSYFIGSTSGPALNLSSGGTIQLFSSLTATNAIETLNAPLVIRGAGGTYTFANDSGNGTSAGGGTLKFGGGITGGAPGPTVLILSGGNTSRNAIDGVIADGAATSLALLKTGPGAWALSGTNTHSGGTTVNGGTLSFYHDANLGAAGSGVTLTGGTLQSSSTYSSHPHAITSASTLDVAVGFATLQNAALSGSGTLTKTGGGTYFLGAGSGNTFSGDLTLAVNGGTFKIGSSVASSPLGGATLSGLTAANTITVNRGASFLIDENQNQLASRVDGVIADRLGSAGNRPAVSMNGGTFFLNAANLSAVMTQTLGALSLSSGASTINVNQVGNGTPELVFSSLSKTPGAFGNFTGNGVAIALGTAALNVPQILFTTAPTMIGAGGAVNSPAISIVPGTRSNNELATYGANGMRALAAAEYHAVAGNDLNGAGPGENVKISDATTPAFTALAAPKIVNALVNSAAVNAAWGMGNTLTLTSGQFIHTPNNSLNISSGALTAATSDLDLSILLNTVTIGANITNNGPVVIALVKNGAGVLVLANTTDNTYSGGTFVNEGQLNTGGATGRRYLGTGAAVINGGGLMNLFAGGATSFAGSLAAPAYTVRSGGQLNWNNTSLPATNEFFKVEAGAVFNLTQVAAAAGFNLSGPSRNFEVAAGAVLAEQVAGANIAIKNGAGLISSLTTPAYYFGLGISLSENVAVGAGTPWLGLSTDHTNSRTYAGTTTTNNTITANSDFILQGKTPAGAGAPGANTLSLGNGASAANIIKITTPNGSVNANIVGRVSLNNDNSQYGSGGNSVIFQVTSGATLTANTATAMGVGERSRQHRGAEWRHPGRRRPRRPQRQCRHPARRHLHAEPVHADWHGRLHPLERLDP